MFSSHNLLPEKKRSDYWLLTPFSTLLELCTSLLNPRHVIVECRGKNEDDDLELEFRRIGDEAPFHFEKATFDLVFADKKSNSIGLQLADLMARPLGMSVIKPDQPNRALAIIRSKLITFENSPENWAIKCLP
jgi:hypothetical protein